MPPSIAGMSDAHADHDHAPDETDEPVAGAPLDDEPAPRDEPDPGAPNEPVADNPVEQDTIETVDPRNKPA